MAPRKGLSFDEKRLRLQELFSETVRIIQFSLVQRIAVFVLFVLDD